MEEKQLNSDEFIDNLKNRQNHFGVWEEGYVSTIKHAMESRYNSLILKDMYIADIIINGDKILIKWNKRFQPLTDEELNEKYGR